MASGRHCCQSGTNMMHLSFSSLQLPTAAPCIQAPLDLPAQRTACCWCCDIAAHPPRRVACSTIHLITVDKCRFSRWLRLCAVKCWSRQALVHWLGLTDWLRNKKELFAYSLYLSSIWQQATAGHSIQNKHIQYTSHTPTHNHLRYHNNHWYRYRYSYRYRRWKKVSGIGSIGKSWYRSQPKKNGL